MTKYGDGDPITSTEEIPFDKKRENKERVKQKGEPGTKTIGPKQPVDEITEYGGEEIDEFEHRKVAEDVPGKPGVIQAK
ncbi:hypothetical protein HJI06_00645 [Staphylococcus epidermidis]|nr:hypothetical protein HJI06_00645 [Staphylococcus epidermidis]